MFLKEKMGNQQVKIFSLLKFYDAVPYVPRKTLLDLAHLPKINVEKCLLVSPKLENIE